MELGAQMRAWAGGVGVRLCMRSMSYSMTGISLLYMGSQGDVGKGNKEEERGKDIRKGIEERI